MYHTIEDQELHPDNYFLADLTSNVVEDECYDFQSKPRQTQITIGKYLKKKDGRLGEITTSSTFHHRPDPDKIDPYLEKLLVENKGYWVDKPTVSAPLVYKLRELYSVELPKKDIKGQGIFYRPDYLELDYFIKLGKAGLLYPDEELSDSEQEIKPDETMCIPLRKKKYKICDPCKPKTRKSKRPDDCQIQKEKSEPFLPFKKIPTGCQCNYYREHEIPPTVPDYPFQNEVDMIRNHEMNKFLKPYKSELLNKEYKKHPPVAFKPRAQEPKRTFPDMMLSNI